MKISRRTLRRMDNLKSFCDFDTTTRIATVHMHYSCVEEIVDTAFSNPEKPVIKEEVVEYLSEILDVVPTEFDVRVSLMIEDYQGYDPDALYQAYNSELETLEYSEKTHNKKKKGLMVIFVLLGLAFLAMAIAAQRNNWFSIRGKGLSMIAVILIEVLFEVYYEESFIFFTVSRIYQKIINRNNDRFKGIIFK